MNIADPTATEHRQLQTVVRDAIGCLMDRNRLTRDAAAAALYDIAGETGVRIEDLAGLIVEANR